MTGFVDIFVFVFIGNVGEILKFFCTKNHFLQFQKNIILRCTAERVDCQLYVCRVGVGDRFEYELRSAVQHETEQSIGEQHEQRRLQVQVQIAHHQERHPDADWIGVHRLELCPVHAVWVRFFPVFGRIAELHGDWTHVPVQ